MNFKAGALWNHSVFDFLSILNKSRSGGYAPYKRTE